MGRLVLFGTAAALSVPGRGMGEDVRNYFNKDNEHTNKLYIYF